MNVNTIHSEGIMNIQCITFHNHPYDGAETFHSTSNSNVNLTRKSQGINEVSRLNRLRTTDVCTTYCGDILFRRCPPWSHAASAAKNTNLTTKSPSVDMTLKYSFCLKSLCAAVQSYTMSGYNRDYIFA